MVRNSRGFTLVELLVVAAITGIVAAAILSLYINVMRSTVASEEVAEVQQGMRIALEQMARDIRMSGFLVPTENPISEARNDRITMVTSSAFNSFARIGNPPVTTTPTFFATGSTAAVTINVVSDAMPRLFSENSSYVRIVRTASGDELGAFKVIGVNNSSLRLEPLDVPAEDVVPTAGDFIVQVPSPSDDPTFPNVVTYWLEDETNILRREWKAGATNDQRTAAINITGLRFAYLLDNGSELPDPNAAPGTAVADNLLDNIVAVRIFLTGLTEERKTGESRVRELQTTVKLRNK